MRFLSRVLVYLSLALFSVSAFASLTDEFEAIKDCGKDFEVIGTVCEEVARVQLAREYREPQYTVITGIAYGDGQRTIGELDVVIFDNKTEQAVKIAEVKCWKNMNGGLNKARDQRRRFLKAVRSSKGLEFRSTSEKNRFFRKSQFKDIHDFVSIAQQGAVSNGYDGELNYTLDELMELRQSMLKCQDQGRCPKH